MSTDRRPTLFSGVLAVVAATAGTAAVAETQPLAVGAVAVGVGALLFVAGATVARSRSRVFGTLLVLISLGTAAGGAGYGASLATDQLHIAVVAPGMVGVFFVAFGVAPLRGSGSRRFVKMASWLVFLSPVLSAGMSYTEPSNLMDVARILGATVAAALVWDLGENSVSLGRQVGRRATTFWNETVHGVGSVLVGAVSAGGAYVAFGFGTGGQPLEGVVVLLVAIVLLVAFLHR
ncbi:MAG: hypothetical protein U5J64_11410 [Halobacteriales archaeon]|nr:hypothetical protein [Halobacteriales archaeon]